MKFLMCCPPWSCAPLTCGKKINSPGVLRPPLTCGEQHQHRSHYVSALTFGDVKAILPSLGVRTMLEVIDVLDTIERLDGLFVDIQLMSDGNAHMSEPYEIPQWFTREEWSDIPF